ncbi:MAG: ATP-binding protein [Deltaproteobacteria bacterium]|nr:ATP-binding protein [Deltaproteobacteria bacterium]
MKRFSEQYLVQWIKTRRRKPLILRGARQVGKSTLVRKFANQQNLLLNEINLERHLELNKVFATLDIAIIRGELEAMVGRSITEPGSLLFLDEIQATPSAIQALRYLYEDLPDIPVIAAGSLLEFTLADHSFSMPVGRIEYHHLGPMTFREFLQAIEPALCRYLDDLEFNSMLPESAHQKLLMRQRQYLFVGGMPEAVLVFQESASLEEAVAVHRRIVSTYEDDFAKYARHHELALLQRTFQLIPRQVGQKVKYVNFSREDRSREIKSAIELLAKARVCIRVFASHCSGIPLHVDINEFAYKLLFLDVGLMNHVCGLDWPTLRRMNDVQLINEGAVAEQFIGQHLVYTSQGADPPRPVYWLREGRKANAEVDYVISCGSNIFPVEVKAGRSGTLRSLHQFVACGKSRKAVRFDINQPSRQQVTNQVPTANKHQKTFFELLSLPLYGVGELERLLEPEGTSS